MSTTPYTNVAPLGSVIPFPYRAEQRAKTKATWLRRVDSGLAVVERVMDFAAVCVAVIASCKLTAGWSGYGDTGYAREAIGTVAVACGLLTVLLLERYGDYRPCLSLLAVRETERLLRVTLWGFGLALFSTAAAASGVARSAGGLAAMLVPVVLALEKWQTRKLMGALRSSAGLTRKAVIVGTGTTARRIYSALVRSPKLGIEPVAFIATREQAEETVIFESSYKRSRQA